MPRDIFHDLAEMQKMSAGLLVSLSMLNRDIGVLMNETNVYSEEQLSAAAFSVGSSLRHVADYMMSFCDCVENLSNRLGG